MNRWDPEPTRFHRWLVRHRGVLRIGAITLMVASGLMAVHTVVTNGFDQSLGSMLGAMAGAGSLLIACRETPRYVEKWDNEHRSSSGSTDVPPA